MNTQNIIDELQASGTLSVETLTAIEEDKLLRLELVHYFDQYKNRNFVLRLLQIFIDLRLERWAEPLIQVSGDTLMLICYILGKHGQIEDCMKVWETKQTDFDTYCYIDGQLIVFGGLEKTIKFLKSQNSEIAKQALEYVIDGSDTGFFDDLDQYYKETPWFI